jgi:DNA uptake protein ComE-like DNA-binding protein
VLARAFGKVDVNAADARELEAVLEIPTELANAII